MQALVSSIEITGENSEGWELGTFKKEADDQRQHSTMQRKSSFTNLTELYAKITKVDKRRVIFLIYLNLNKQFDKAPCGRLVQKVWAHGIYGKRVNWIQNGVTKVRGQWWKVAFPIGSL